jgi:hypothetical protein
MDAIGAKTDPIEADERSAFGGLRAYLGRATAWNSAGTFSGRSRIVASVQISRSFPFSTLYWSAWLQSTR